MTDTKPYPVMNMILSDDPEQAPFNPLPFVILLREDGLVAETENRYRYSGLFIDSLDKPTDIRFANVYTDEFETEEVTRFSIEDVTAIRRLERAR